MAQESRHSSLHPAEGDADSGGETRVQPRPKGLDSGSFSNAHNETPPAGIETRVGPAPGARGDFENQETRVAAIPDTIREELLRAKAQQDRLADEAREVTGRMATTYSSDLHQEPTNPRSFAQEPTYPGDFPRGRGPQAPQDEAAVQRAAGDNEISQHEDASSERTQFNATVLPPREPSPYDGLDNEDLPPAASGAAGRAEVPAGEEPPQQDRAEEPSRNEHSSREQDGAAGQDAEQSAGGWNAPEPGNETRVELRPKLSEGTDPKTQVMAPATSTPAATPSIRQERKNIPVVELPADLRLPSFDFRASSSPDVMAAKAAGAKAPLPEHLQLPSFPDLGRPPTPKNEVSVPPPMPKKAAPPPLPSLSDPSPPVLDMSLPEIAPRPTQRGLTLISSQQKDKKPLGKRLIWPSIVGGTCLLVALGLFWQRERVVSALAPRAAPIKPPPPTPQERAKEELATGGVAYMAKDYQVAIKHFEAALVDDPRLVEAHRSLGIVYATLHDQAKAVRHYQDYLALNPHAPDATDVQKIIDDYKKVQAKAAHDAAPPPPPPEAPKHKKGGKSQGRKH